jgi:hypothetical protein
MQSVKRRHDSNIGGSIIICFVPIADVDIANFPSRQYGTLNISEEIPLLGDAKWLKIETTRESITNTDDGKATSMYDHSVGGFYAGDYQGVAGQFDKMNGQRFLCLRKDANGFWLLKGTPKEPLTFSYKKIAKDSVTGLKGFSFEFSGMCTKPEIYFYADFETDEGNVSNSESTSATARMVDSDNVLLDTKIILAGNTDTLIAPDAIVDLNGEDFLNVKSGETADILLRDINGIEIIPLSVVGKTITVETENFKTKIYNSIFSNT